MQLLLPIATREVSDSKGTVDCLTLNYKKKYQVPKRETMSTKHYPTNVQQYECNQPESG